MADFLEATVDKFVFRVATDRHYSPDGVWVQFQGNKARVGLSDYFQQRSGDVAFAHCQPVGTRLASGDELAELETIKANASVFAPIAGTLIEINAALDPSPEVINQEPYGKGWLAVIETDNMAADRATLLDPRAYLEVMRSQAEEESGG
jgi:glycine cleavage system H protein